MDPSTEKYAQHLFEQNTIRRSPQQPTKKANGESANPKPRLALPLENITESAPTHGVGGLQPLPQNTVQANAPVASLSQMRAHKIAHLNHLLNLPTNASLAATPPEKKSDMPPAVTAAAPIAPSAEQQAVQQALRASQARLKRTQLQLDMAQILLQNQVSLEHCLNEVLDRLLKNFGLWAGALRTVSIGHPVRPERLHLQKMHRRLPDWPLPGSFTEKAPIKPLHTQNRTYQQWTYGIYHKETCWGQLAIAYSPAQKLAAEDEIALQALIDDLGFFLSVWHNQQQQLSAQDQDPLTGLLNHSAFQQALEKHLNNKIDLPLSLVVLNLDLLRQINEVHGFEQGDKALQSVAKLLSTPEFLPLTVSRFGPESFVFLCPQTDANTAAKKAETLRRAIAQLSLPGKYNSSVGLTASFGVVSMTQTEGKAHQRMLEQAFEALEQAKTLGRNQVKIYSETPVKISQEVKTQVTAPVVAPAITPAAPPKTVTARIEARKWSDILAEQQEAVRESWLVKSDDYGVEEVSEAVNQLNGRLERLLNALFGLLDQESSLDELAKMPVSYFMPSPIVAAIRRGSANSQLIAYEVAFMLLQESLVEVLKGTHKDSDALEPAIDAFFHCINDKMTQLKGEVKR